MADYSKQRLNTLLSSALDRATPDLREQAASAPVTPLDAPDGIVPAPVRRRPALRRAAMSLAACLVLVLGLGSFSFFQAAAYIGIDVNPSLQIVANRFDRVLSVTPLNADAEVILDGMELQFLDLDIAVNALVGSMALHGYFESGKDVEVLVSVTGGSDDHNRTVQSHVVERIELAAANVGAKAAVHTPDSTIPATPAPPVSPDAPAVISPAPSPALSPSVPPVLSPSPSRTPDRDDDHDDRDDEDDDDTDWDDDEDDDKDKDKTNNGNHNGWDKNGKNDTDDDDDEKDDD